MEFDTIYRKIHWDALTGDLDIHESWQLQPPFESHIAEQRALMVDGPINVT